MYNLKIIQHSDISQAELNEIIGIKTISWPYPYEAQMEWIAKNLKDSDFHLLLLLNSNLVAYLNFITISLIIDHTVSTAFGIGNVCSREKGKGYGVELMKQTNQFIIKKDTIGLLFCKQTLVKFYKKCGWDIIDKNQLSLDFDNKNIETMIFNFHLPIKQLVYKGNIL